MSAPSIWRRETQRTRCAAAPRHLHLHLAVSERSDETLTLGVVQECHTVMRTRTMWATVPLLLFHCGSSVTWNSKLRPRSVPLWVSCALEQPPQPFMQLQAGM